MSPETLATSAIPAFDLTEDQRAVREMVRDFAEQEIRPIAGAIDETHELPLETTKKMGELGPKGVSAFIVVASTRGVTKGKREKKLGIHASDTREIAFAGARVPAENLLGEPNKGYGVALATLGGGRIGIAAQALGIAQAALEASVQYANERFQFDRKIGEFDAVRAMLADSAVELETARLLVYQAAWLRDQGRPHVKEASLAKGHASEP